MTNRVRWALFSSGILLFSQAARLPSPVRDIAVGSWASGYHMDYSIGYLLLAPFCGVADAWTVLGLKSSYALLALALLACLLLRRIKRIVIALGLFLGFLAWAILCPRPMAKLVAENPAVLLVDFHSHSRVSHDGRPSFSAQDNMRWHEAQGYGASFITDHNKIDSSREAKEISRKNWPGKRYVSLEGEEISLQKTHLAVLGVHERIDNRPYDSDHAKIHKFIKDTRKKGMLVIASLPEYWFYHWGNGVQDFITWGVDGFEVINSAPKALDFPPAMRSDILALCSTHNLFITGISDTHGYGYATAAWNAVLLPGWHDLDADTREKALLAKLKKDRFKAVQVLARARFEHEETWQLGIAPLVSLIYVWRSLTPALCLSWIAWIWFAALLYSPRFRFPYGQKA